MSQQALAVLAGRAMLAVVRGDNGEKSMERPTVRRGRNGLWEAVSAFVSLKDQESGGVFDMLSFCLDSESN